MDLKEFFITDTNEFNKIENKLNNIFNLDNRLPENVFSESYAYFVFDEFDLAMGAYFWPKIKELAVRANDESIFVGVIEPDPRNYFYKETGRFNWANLPINLTEDNYWDILNLEPEQNPTEALLYNTDIMVWFSPSLNWAIWGEREYGVCVLAVNNKSMESTLNSWKKVNDEAVKDWIRLNFRKQKMFKHFIDLLQKNYSNN